MNVFFSSVYQEGYGYVNNKLRLNTRHLFGGYCTMNHLYMYHWPFLNLIWICILIEMKILSFLIMVITYLSLLKCLTERKIVIVKSVLDLFPSVARKKIVTRFFDRKKKVSMECSLPLAVSKFYIDKFEKLLHITGHHIFHKIPFFDF